MVGYIRYVMPTRLEAAAESITFKGQRVIVTGDPIARDLEQLARSVAMSGVLGDRDRLDVVTALRRLADIDKATKRHPSAGRSFAT